MRKALFLCIIALVAGMISCGQGNTSYEVKGTLPDSTFDGKTLYIMRHDDNTNIDSTVVAGTDFVFKGVANTAEFSRISVDKHTYANFILENGVIDIDFNTRTGSRTTPLNIVRDENMQKEDSLNTILNEKFKAIDELTEDQAEQNKLKEEFYESFKNEYIDLHKSSFEANSNNTIGAGYLLRLSYYVTPGEMEELIAKAGDWVLSRNRIQKLIQTNTAIKNTAEGKPFTDFSIEQEDGSIASLSDYVGKGKYVLVDFWASWCGPCIRETPVIAEVYNKYKNKNFEVLGVAVWDEPKNTKEAIEKHGITWPQIINAQSIPTDLYGISGIPHIILFGPDGAIVARGLRGDGLKAKVAEVMED